MLAWWLLLVSQKWGIMSFVWIKIFLKYSYYSNLDEVVRIIKKEINPKNIEIPDWIKKEN